MSHNEKKKIVTIPISSSVQFGKGQMDLLGCHVTDQVNIVVKVSHKVVRNVVGGSASVSDELPLGHLVFDVRAGQVDGQQDETVAEDVDGIRTKAEVPDQPRVTRTEPVTEFGDERLQVLASLLRGVDVSEEVPQSVRKELVTEIMKRHQLIQDVPPLIQVDPQHLPVEPSGVEDKLGQLRGVIHQNAFR